MKSWEKALNYKWDSGASHMFFLYLDVASEILHEKKFETLPEHLVSSSAASKARFIAFYNRGAGIYFATDLMEKEFIKFLKTLYPETNRVSGQNVAEAMFKLHRNELAYAFNLFNEMLKFSRNDAQKIESPSKEKTAEAEESKDPFFAVIIEYIETIAPQDCATASCQTDRDSLVMLLNWARDCEIRDSRNIVILTGESLIAVAQQLCSETNGIVPLKLHLSDLEDREKTYSALRQIYESQKGDMTAEIFASLSAGMSRNAIIGMVKEQHLKQTPITPELLFEKKKKFIEEQSGGLLEVMRPIWGIKAIGGLQEHKRYIQEVVKAMREKNLMSVPMGILLLGAPGTGKTVFAQAMAYEAGIPFVIMKNIRNPYVGMSERNQSFAFEIISAMAPVIVFVDEIDQQIQSRSANWDNTGINNRMNAQFFQFLSNTELRGRVMWIGATNRPDLMDEALLREGRFDEKIPFFPPNWKERSEILKAILHKMEVQAKILNEKFSWIMGKESIRNFGWMSHWHFESNQLKPCDPDVHLMGTEEDDEIPFTGAQIETIVRKAYTIAGNQGKKMSKKHLADALKDFLPPPDIVSYREMTQLAILHCNSMRFIPEGKWRDRALRIRTSITTKNRL